MIQSAMINFEIEKNSRKYVFSVMPGSPYKDCFEVLAEFSNEILAMAKESEERAKKEDAANENELEASNESN